MTLFGWCHARDGTQSFMYPESALSHNWATFSAQSSIPFRTKSTFSFCLETGLYCIAQAASSSWNSIFLSILNTRTTDKHHHDWLKIYFWKLKPEAATSSLKCTTSLTSYYKILETLWDACYSLQFGLVVKRKSLINGVSIMSQVKKNWIDI